MVNFNVGTLNVYITHSKEKYNPICRRIIPEYWEAELEVTGRLLNYFEANNVFTDLSIYGTSQVNQMDAITDLISQLKEAKVSGKLVLIT